MDHQEPLGSWLQLCQGPGNFRRSERGLHQLPLPPSEQAAQAGKSWV